MSLTGHTGIQLAVLSTSFGPGRKKRARHSRRAEMQLVHQAKATPASVVRVGNLSRAHERPEASMTQNSRVVRKAKGPKKVRVPIVQKWAAEDRVFPALNQQTAWSKDN